MSSDPPDKLKAWRAREQLNYDLLSDPERRVIRAWEAGVSLLGVAQLPLTRRSCWVIDERGVVIDMKVGISPDASVRLALRALEANSRD